jgi:hypothetical protein
MEIVEENDLVYFNLYSNLKELEIFDDVVLDLMDMKN